MQTGRNSGGTTEAVLSPRIFGGGGFFYCQTAISRPVNTSFFCTNDKAFEKIDNYDIFQSMVLQYENLKHNNEDSIIKKTIIIMLNNDNFMNSIMEYYNVKI